MFENENIPPPESQPLILVVDDNMSNLQLIGNILKEKNYKIGIATNGVEALKIIDKKTPDLILLDVMMPEMDGFEVCRRLKLNPETAAIPIIFLTARSEEKDIVQGFKIGAVDYISKPFKKQEVTSRIKTHIDLKIALNTVLKQNNELSELNSKLKNVIASKDKFFGIIAHDLKNPFSALIGLSEIVIEMKDELESEKKLAFIKDIQKVSLNTYELLENLLHWSRSQTGVLRIVKQTLDVRALCDEAIMVLSENIRKKRILVVSNIKTGCFINADSDMIRTVIRNLITNAIKFTKSDGKIIIGAKIKEETIEISFEDNGVGIPENIVNRLFQIDSSFSTPGTNNESGTGLGLILCKDFIDKNGGTIRVESKEGFGSSFFIELPQSKENFLDSSNIQFVDLGINLNTLPPVELLASLQFGAQTGDFYGIADVLSKIEAQHPESAEFALLIRKLNKQFDFEAISRVLKGLHK